MQNTCCKNSLEKVVGLTPKFQRSGKTRITPFGWVKVRGFIDEFELKQYKLMPMGAGKLFLPVNAAIRKKIKKQAGDTVKIVLYPDFG